MSDDNHTKAPGQGHVPGRPTTSLMQQAPAAPAGVPANDHGSENGRDQSRKRARRLLVPSIILILLVGAYITFHFWYNDSFYVATENAKIAGAMVQVGALNAGRVEAISADVGSRVERDEVVASVSLPSVVGMAQGNSKLGYVGTNELSAEVRSPISGVVIARQGSVGDTVAPGQSLLTVVDPSAQWVVANIEETKVARLQRGQRAEVHVDALGKTFEGRIDSVTPATTATFSLLPQSNGSGNFTKVTQLMPVKILVDNHGEMLPLGGSVEVNIRVADPGGILSWLR